MSAGTLFLVPAAITDPKGGDASPLVGATLPPSTLAVIANLRAFAVENAKSARAFLKAAGINVPIQALAISEIGHSPDAGALEPLVQLLKSGVDVGLLSESGCPAVADPGAQLVRLAHEADIRVVPLVGPSSLLLALMASGLEGQRFAFCGYLPVKPAERTAAIRELESRSRRAAETQIAIETPYRNAALFAALVSGLTPSSRLALAIDLTLPSESILMKRVSQWRQTDAPSLDKRQAVFLFLAG
jgi:16S rRNA (cytidine1402-2'-O)-methyltransferase